MHRVNHKPRLDDFNMNSSYKSFVATKAIHHKSTGIDCHQLNNRHLYDFQMALVKWALRKGRAALFADTGLGKTRMQLVWADEIHRSTGVDVIILCPLSVAAQTKKEGQSIGINVTHCHESKDVRCGINIINYDRIHKIDTEKFGAVILDESSIIKHHDAKTFTHLRAAFSHAQYKLCATATPAPNDWIELGTHAEYLGICTRSEMLSEYFTHDGGETQKWRLKGHAQSEFWRWVSGWGAMIRSPSDLGFDASLYKLPPLEYQQHTVKSSAKPPDGQLFALDAHTLSSRRTARRDSMSQRVSACADIINASDEPWIVWCELNAEGAKLKSSINDSVEVKGSDNIEYKESTLDQFASGETRILITKPKIAGFGLNWQHCRNIAFIGVTDSWESYYQAIRRCWRFGQKKPVRVHIFVSQPEGAVLLNLIRKESEADKMFAALTAQTSAILRDNVIGNARQSNAYIPSKQIEIPKFIRGV